MYRLFSERDNVISSSIGVVDLKGIQDSLHRI